MLDFLRSSIKQYHPFFKREWRPKWEHSISLIILVEKFGAHPNHRNGRTGQDPELLWPHKVGLDRTREDYASATTKRGLLTSPMKVDLFSALIASQYKVDFRLPRGERVRSRVRRLCCNDVNYCGVYLRMFYNSLKFWRKTDTKPTPSIKYASVHIPIRKTATRGGGHQSEGGGREPPKHLSLSFFSSHYFFSILIRGWKEWFASVCEHHKQIQEIHSWFLS